MRKAFVEPVALPEPRFRDGLGIRYVRTDGTDGQVEVLRPLWDVGSMQATIRQRVTRLASFRQARFVPVRATEVPRDDVSTIEVVSDYVSGHRLSQYLEASREGTVSIATSTAIYVIRELLGALALLRESRGVTHGAVGPERMLITPKGRVVVADYVLGAAIERLDYTRPRLWREFRIPLTAGKGLPKLDDRADVMQVGMTALALLLGRPVELAEYPDRLGDLIASLGQASKAAGRSPVPAALIGWVKRAVFKDPNGKFGDVSDARLSLEAVISKLGAAVGGAAALKSLAEAFGRHAAAVEAEAAAAAAEVARRAALAAEEAEQAALQEQDADAAAAAPLTNLVPAFTSAPDAPGESAAARERSATKSEAVPATESEPPVGWRMPEAAPAEDTLPTSPLIPIDDPSGTPAAEAFAEELLDLAVLAASDDEAELCAAEPARAAETVEAPLEQAETTGPAEAAQASDAVVELVVDLRDLESAEAPEGSEAGLPQQPADTPAIVDAALAALESASATTPAACADALPEWRLLANPIGATAPTIDVEVPTETLEDLVAEFAAAMVVEEPSAAVAEPPALVEELPAAMADATALVEEPSAVVAEPPALVEELPAAMADATALVEEPSAVVAEPPALVQELPAAMADATALVEEPSAVVAEPPALVEELPAAMADAPAPVMEPPAALLEASVPALEVPAEFSVPAPVQRADEVPPPTEAPSILHEILGLQEAQAAAQAAAEVRPAPLPDIAAWGFVEELVHHDARFETRAPAEAELPDATTEEVHSPTPAAEVEAPPLAIAGASTPSADVPADAAAASVAVQSDAPPAADEVVPALPADWFIEVGRRASVPLPVPAARFEPEELPFVSAPPPPPPAEVHVPAHAEAFEEPAPSLPPATWRPELPALEEEPRGPVFPRVAPSVRRVRAEARRRRLARIGDSLVAAFQAIVGIFVAGGAAIASGTAAAAAGVVSVFAAAGRGVGLAGAAILAGAAALASALLRGIGGAIRATASGAAMLGRGAASGAAAGVRGVAALARAAGHGALGGARVLGRGILGAARAMGSVAHSAARVSTAVISAVAGGTGRALRALGTAGLAAAGMTAKAAAAIAGAAGGAFSSAARGLASGLGALGRSSVSAIAAAARGLASGLGALGRGSASALAAAARGTAAVSARGGRVAGRTVGQTASTAAAAGRALGRGTALGGRGIGRAAVAVPRTLYFVASDVADRLPRPIFRPWYLAAALAVIVAVAGVPYAKAWLVTLKPAAAGTIRIESRRPDALVTIDGVAQGRAPMTASIPVGRHRIEIAIAGETRAHDVDVAEGRETVLQAVGADVKATGSIHVTTDPAGVEVLVDGVLHGRSPLTVENLAEGAHTLLVRDGSGSVRQTVRVRADEALNAALQIRPGWLAVFAPVKLDILEDGRSIGSTEGGRILAAPGPHTIEVVSQAMGFRETRQVEVRPGGVAAVTIQMPPATIEVVAPADAEILVDGQSVGLAPLGPIQVAVGTREIVMRHPALGERRQIVMVAYNSPVRVVFE